MASQGKSSKHRPVKVKVEKNDNSQCSIPENDDKDLTHYIKDRVELMRQVFSILRDRELLAMAPDCLREFRIDDIQEMLLDEALGISSKRLRSILEGYQCPSDTESSENSSNEPLETISLDSISSEENDILLHQEQRARKKHSKKKATSKDSKRKLKSAPNQNIATEKSNSSGKIKKSKKDSSIDDAHRHNLEDEGGTGMTVLELLELQARARAIRAQLAAVEVKNVSSDSDENVNAHPSSESDGDEVVIKEEPPEIVEIQSSSDEKEKHKNQNCSKKSNKNKVIPISKGNVIPPIQDESQNRLSNRNIDPSISSNLESSKNQSVQPPRKIKLIRTNLLVSVTESTNDSAKSITKKIDESSTAVSEPKKSEFERVDRSKEKNDQEPVKRPDREKPASDDDDDVDEITLELSDIEKMDFLEGLGSPKSINPYSKSVSTDTIVSNKSFGENRHYRKSSNRSIKTKNAKSNPDQISHEHDECSSKVDSPKKTDNFRDSNQHFSQELSRNKSDEDNLNKESELTIKEMSEGECSSSSEKSVIVDDKFEMTHSFSEKTPENNNETCEKENVEPLEAEVNCTEEKETGITFSLNIPQMKPKSDDDVTDSIFEISDDSDDDALCGEPTREEIEELSRKIDSEIEKESFHVSTDPDADPQIGEAVMESKKLPESTTDTDASWKTRWLKSDKVKRVLATSNLCNALRKKNVELKKKLEKGPEKDAPEVPSGGGDPDEGSVTQYETLPANPRTDGETMATDAKQLMKMYKKLLKMHDANSDGKSAEEKKRKKEKKKNKKEKKEKKKSKSNPSDADKKRTEPSS